MTETPIRWGFLGASRIGRSALGPAVASATGHVLHAVAARDADRAREFAGAFDAPRAYGSYEELLADPDVDAVYNALPNDLHLPLTVAALEAGKSVLCEKPLALNAAEVRELRAAEARTGRFVLEAFAYRFHPQFDRVAEILASGEIGEVRAARVAFCFVLDRPQDFRWEPGKGGGALYDVGCYCVNGLRLWLGREPRRVAAVAHDVGGIDATTNGLLDFGDGLAASFHASQESGYHQSLTFVGTRGQFTLHAPFASRLDRAVIDVNGREEVFGPADGYRLMVEHVGRAVRGEEALRWTLDDAEKQARVLDGVFEAARDGGWVEV